jgi:CRISPR-associated protein Csb2
VPSFARLHEAFVAAAGGGPTAVPDDRVLVATADDRAAVLWLEEQQPVGVRVPETILSRATARRYRWRASPVTLQGDAFEARSALDGPITYYWPAPAWDVAERLRALAGEITHVGRADSIARVTVSVGDGEGDHGRLHEPVAGRGAGLVAPVPGAGRFAALERAHREVSEPGPHGTGSKGKQAPDLLVTGANEDATVLRRFAAADSVGDWPYAEVLSVELRDQPGLAAALVRDPALRISGAVAVHRSLVKAIGDDVPSFVTGRDGAGPLRGHGHLAIHVVPGPDRTTEVLLAIPHGVDVADRLRLRDAVRAGLRPRIAGRTVRLNAIEHRSARGYWGLPSPVMRSATPVVLDAPGVPKRGVWSLDDATICSVGYAFRGVLERDGLDWGTGWGFRRSLVAHLRSERGVAVQARRVHRSASRYAHRAAPGDLLVAVDAQVRLGSLASPDGGFVAIGRARHLGGGLLIPEGSIR